MFLNKIFHFVKGYVIIKVTGFNIERFLYLCAKRKIKLISIGKKTDDGVIVHINISDFFKVMPIRRKTGTQICILKKCGLPFLIKRIKKRNFLVVGLLSAVILMFASSRFIWSVELVGDSEEKSYQVAQAAERAGVRIGAYKRNLPDGEDMKSIILSNTDNLVWAWVYINGTKAVVEFKEGTEPPRVVNKSMPCDIIANKDGILVSITEKNGEKRALKNDTVAKGDILIAGTIQRPDGGYKTVHAIGDIYAYTWYEESGVYPLCEEIIIPTGRKKEYKTLKLFSKCFNMYFKENPGYEEYEISEELNELKTGRNNYLGVGIYNKTYYEVKRETYELSCDLAVEKGRCELEERIAKKLLPSSRLTDKKVEYKMLDDNTVRVTVMMEFIEKIGEETAIVSLE